MTPGVQSAVEAVLRAQRGRLLSVLIARLRDFQLAEDALQEAAESALRHWGRSGIPERPEGWLLRAGYRKALDRLRGEKRHRARLETLATLSPGEAVPAPQDEIPDERLRLIFTCCHPALEPKSRVALTLRTLCGLTTAEIARAFLDTEPAMGQRLSRAKAKIAAAVIAYQVPQGPDLPERLGSVLSVIYLIFNEGYSATFGPQTIRHPLCQEALFLGRMVADLLPDPETMGLLSLMLSVQARAPARQRADGLMVPLSEQDRGQWDSAMIAEALALIDRAQAMFRPGPFQFKAAISALHVAAPSHDATDWQQMLLLYTALLEHEPSSVVRLNRAMVLAQCGREGEALSALDDLSEDLGRYQPYYAARAELSARLGQAGPARQAYAKAIAMAGTEGDRALLQARRDRLLGDQR